MANKGSFTPGDPRAGRPQGSQNKTGRDARAMAQRLVCDPEYVEGLRVRLIAGKLGALEQVLWAYAFGPPPERPISILSDALEELPLPGSLQPFE
jgi:hypothetical protein